MTDWSDRECPGKAKGMRRARVSLSHSNRVRRVAIVPTEDESTLEAFDQRVLNPALFGYLGKQIGMTFLGVEGRGFFVRQARS